MKVGFINFFSKLPVIHYKTYANTLTSEKENMEQTHLMSCT